MEAREFDRSYTFEFGKSLTLRKVIQCLYCGDHITEGRARYFVNEEEVIVCDWAIDNTGEVAVNFKFKMGKHETKSPKEGQETS